MLILGYQELSFYKRIPTTLLLFHKWYIGKCIVVGMEYKNTVLC